MGENELGQIPLWSLWLSTTVLSLAFIIALPINGATVLIFWRRKKLRHLVNFVLLLDCVSHIVLCLVCIPIHIVTVWSSSLLESAGLSWLATLQQLVGNFANLYSTFLTVSIAILRYRRLCWKKKDKFSAMNAIKWSVSSGSVAIGLTFSQGYTSLMTNEQLMTLIFYVIKMSLIILSMLIVFFCYIRVSQRVWANTANQEKLMDPMKLKRSRSVHMRATVHSCVQIILVVATMAPHLYEQTLVAFHSCSTPSGPVERQDEEQRINQVPKLEAEELSSASSSASETPPAQIQSFSRDNHLATLIGITLNYTLLALGTPMAYIASCHRFREQFASILCGRGSNPYSPQHSASPHQRRTHQHSSQQTMDSRYRRYSTPISRTKPFSSSTTTGNPVTLTVTTSTGSSFSPSKSLLSRSMPSSTKSSKGSSKRKRSRYSVVDFGEADSVTMLNDDGDTTTRYTPSPSPQPADAPSGILQGRRTSAVLIPNGPSPGLNLSTIIQNYGGLGYLGHNV